MRASAASAGARPPLIVPRVNLEGFGEAELNAIVRFSGRREQIVSLIVAKVKEHPLDGIVLEAGYAIKHFSDLVRLLGQRLHEMRKHLVVVVPPIRGTGSVFGGDDLLKMAPFVDHFSLMTYDYTTSGQEGPNAPIKWCAAAVEHLARRDEHRQQVLMGLNFYGNDYVEGASGASTVLGHDIVARLSTHSNRQLHFEWAPIFAEHTLRYVDSSGARHAVVYPTRASIQARIDLARQLHVGIAIWEIGQGLDYFFELL